MRAAAAVVARPGRVLAGVAAFAAVAAALGLQTPGRLGRASNDFVAHGSESLRAERAVERASRLSATPQVLVLVRAPTPRRLTRVASAIRAEPTFTLVGQPVLSRTGREAIVA